MPFHTWTIHVLLLRAGVSHQPLTWGRWVHRTGTLAWVKNALNFTTYFQYNDCCDKLDLVTYPDGTTTDYSWTYGRLDWVKDRNGRYTYYDEYDGKLQVKKVRDAEGNIIQYAYDENDNLETVTD